MIGNMLVIDVNDSENNNLKILQPKEFKYILLRSDSVIHKGVVAGDIIPPFLQQNALKKTLLFFMT